MQMKFTGPIVTFTDSIRINRVMLKSSHKTIHLYVDDKNISSIYPEYIDVEQTAEVIKEYLDDNEITISESDLMKLAKWAKKNVS